MKLSTARRWGLAGLLVAGTAVTPALAAPTKDYTATIAPGTAAAGHTVSFAVTLAVPSSEQQQLGSAQLTVPSGFEVQSASSPGTESTTSSTALFDGLEIQPGEELTVTVVASIDCDPATTASRWTVEAKQANDFNGTPGNVLTTSSILDTPVVGQCTPCDDDEAAETCLLEQSVGGARFAITGLPNADNDAGNLTLAINAGLRIDCSGYTETTDATAIVDFTGDRQKIATLIVPKRSLPKGGYNGLQVCFAAPYSFTGGTLQTFTFDWNHDGAQEPVWLGLLADCSATVAEPCVFRRDRLGDGSGIIQARLPRTGDPAYRG